MQVKDILKAKGAPVTIAAGLTIGDAMDLLIENKVGSLVVTETNGKPCGIITERDIFRLMHTHKCDIMKLPLRNNMTTKLVIGLPDDDVDYIMTIMTENRIRHVPIMEGQELKGLVSIGDVVKSQMKATHVENKYLKDYIADKYPG